MVRAFGLNAHVEQGQADLAPHVFALVLGRNVHVGRMVKRDLRRVAVFIRFEQIELNFRTELHRDACRLCIGNSAAQDRACVAGKRRAVGVADVAEHAHDLAVRGTPGQDIQRRRIGEQQKIGLFGAAEPADRRGVKGDAVFRGAAQLAWQDGDVFLSAKRVAKGKADELDVLFLHKVEYLLCCVDHSVSLRAFL